MIISQMVALQLLTGAGTAAIVTTTSEQEDVVYRRMHNVDDVLTTYSFLASAPNDNYLRLGDSQPTYWRNPPEPEE